jgi:hypothetical protein
MMGKMRSAVIAAATAGVLIVAGAGPAAADGEPLAVTSTGLTDGQDVSGFSRFYASWTDGANIAKVEVYVSGHLRYSVVNGNWNLGLRAGLLPAENNTDVPLTVKVYDTAGNTAEATTTVHADQTPPVATISPAPVLGVPLRGVITVTATGVSDDVAEVALMQNPGTATLATATAAPWTLTYNTVGSGASGAYIKVTDRAGNWRTYSGWTFDNTPPSISDLDDYHQPLRRVRGLTQMHVGFSSGNRWEWWVDGKLVWSHHSTTPGGFTTGDGLTYDFGQTARTATVEVRVWDTAGNEATRSYSLTVDVAGPTVTSFTPASEALVRGSQISSTVAATDPAGVMDGTLNNGNSVFTPSPLTLTVAAGADGRKPLTWRVTDNLGNSTTVTRYVTVDNTKPAVTVTKAPANGAKVKGTVAVSASATDRNGITRVELLIGGKVVASDATAGYSFSINTAKYATKLPMQLRAYDRAGNVTTTTTRTWSR